VGEGGGKRRHLAEQQDQFMPSIRNLSQDGWQEKSDPGPEGRFLLFWLCCCIKPAAIKPTYFYNLALN
jgi:hypothetical protein